MRWFQFMRQQKLLSLSLLLVTLSIGIVIGTLLNTGVHAARGQVAAPDASPLVVPSAVQLGNEFTKLAKRLEPSVVYITADYTPKVAEKRDPQEGGQDPSQGNGNGDGLDLFKKFFHNGPSTEDLPPRAFRQEQSGTGFIVDKNGYIITNHHVIAKVDHIKVKLHGDDSTEYRARVVGIDPETDLAVIKIDPQRPLQPVTIGNSDAVQVGDWAVAIGSPFGLEASVTAGIVSAMGRDIGGALQLQRFIQTDAAINPGNSGGPLLNIRGEVIGVNTMIATQSGGYQGIGFALPVNMVARVYNDIIRTGRVTRGSIGIEWSKADDKPELFKALGTSSGVLISKVQKDGPADKAGIKADDIIIALNGKPIKNGDDLVSRVSETPVGNSVDVTVDRDRKHMEFKVTILDRAQVFKDRPEFAELRQDTPESDKAEEQPQYKFGIKLHVLTDAERTSMGLDARAGLLVQGVDSGSFAEDIGLFEKDVIVAINRQPVSTVDDVRKIQATLRPGDAVAFRIMRSSGTGRGRAPQWTTFFVSGTLPVQ
ncbi:MAG TPA: Do family serine endopeptidase [Bryobacteraceae bacterium]|nr:Do family serine endopeptidase [Bryobacteraceae bacterium]